jgi:integrase
MIFKRRKRYWMDATIDGVRYREPLRTCDWKEAKDKEKTRIVEISQGRFGARGSVARQTLSIAIDSYIEDRVLHSAEKSCRTDRERSRPLRKAFGDVPLRKISARSILDYQKARIAEVSGRTVNLEVGLMRRILKKNRAWSRIADDVRNLPERPKEAKVLTQDQKEALLELAKTKPDWNVAYCAAVLALNTTCRSCELRGLQWSAVDWADMTITIRRSSTKTNAGARVIPLNADALIALMELRDRIEKLMDREDEKESSNKVQPNHFVFPACEHGNFDANRSMKNWRTAWRALTRAVTCPTCQTIQRPADKCKNVECSAEIKELRSSFEGLRFHDLRHQAITELAEKGVPEQTLMGIAGHVSRRMLDHYSHARLAAKRSALDSLTSQSTSQNEKTAQTAAVTASF